MATLSNLFGMLAGPAVQPFLSQSQTNNPVSNFLYGQPETVSKFAKYEPQQQMALNQLLQSGMQGLQNPQAGFQPLAQRAREQFQQQVVPMLAERFTSLGGGDTRLTSPAFASALGQAGATLESDLAAQAADYGFKNRDQLLQLLTLGLTPQYEQKIRPQTSGFFQEGSNVLLQLLPKLLPLLL